mmetsp:Transcript_14714/g.48882  ORF Transcript_14714/g.48882 Transcript_14714/m.48882 type:complete len:212 (+) Transcript_14714:312-947(+)
MHRVDLPHLAEVGGPLAHCVTHCHGAADAGAGHASAVAADDRRVRSKVDEAEGVRPVLERAGPHLLASVEPRPVVPDPAHVAGAAGGEDEHAARGARRATAKQQGGGGGEHGGGDEDRRPSDGNLARHRPGRVPPVVARRVRRAVRPDHLALPAEGVLVDCNHLGVGVGRKVGGRHRAQPRANQQRRRHHRPQRELRLHLPRRQVRRRGRV